MDYSAQGGWTDKEEQSNDYVAKNCNNLVFYSVFYRQPVQIHKKGGGAGCLLYTSPSPRDSGISRMPSSA